MTGSAYIVKLSTSVIIQYLREDSWMSIKEVFIGDWVIALNVMSYDESMENILLN